MSVYSTPIQPPLCPHGGQRPVANKLGLSTSYPIVHKLKSNIMKNAKVIATKGNVAKAKRVKISIPEPVSGDVVQNTVGWVDTKTQKKVGDTINVPDNYTTTTNKAEFTNEDGQKVYFDITTIRFS